MRTGRHHLGQVLRALQRQPVPLSGAVDVTRQLVALSLQHTRLELPAVQACLLEPVSRQRSALAGLGELALVQRQGGFVQMHHGQPDRIALLLEEVPRVQQVFACERPLRHAGLHPGALHQGPGFLDRGLPLARRLDGAVIQVHALGQQVGGAVGIGQRALGLGHALRRGAAVGVAQHQRQPVHGRPQPPAQQFQPAQHVVDGGQQRHQPARLRPLAGPLGHLQRLAEAELRRQHAGQAVVGHDRVGMVPHAGEAQRRAAEVGGGVGVAVLPQQHRAQVLLHLAGGQFVAAGVERGQRPAPAVHRLVVPAQHGQAHHLRHAGVVGVVGLAVSAQRGFGALQRIQRLVRLAAHQRRDAAGPGRRGVDHAVVGPCGHACQRAGDHLGLAGRRGPGAVALSAQLDRQVMPGPGQQAGGQAGLARIGLDPLARPGRRGRLRAAHDAGGRGTSSGGSSITTPGRCSASCTGPPGTWSKRNSSMSSSAT